MTQPQITENGIDEGSAALEEFLQGVPESEEGIPTEEDTDSSLVDQVEEEEQVSEEVQRLQALEAERNRYREENERLQREASQTQRVQFYEARTQDYASRQYQANYNHLLNEVGLTSEEAQRQAAERYASDVSMGQSLYREKLALERLVSSDEGVSQDVLEPYWDENTMRQAARNYKANGGADQSKLDAALKRISELEAQVHRNEARPSSYNRPGMGSAGSGDEVLNQRYGRGEIAWSPQVAAARRRLGYD